LNNDHSTGDNIQNDFVTGRNAGNEKAHRSALRRRSASNVPKRSIATTAAIVGTVLVVLVIVIIVLVSVGGQKARTAVSGGDGLGLQRAPTRVVGAITHVSSSSFAEAGYAVTSSGPYTGSLTVLKNQPALTLSGKPVIAYIGSDFCPYCAATRWPLAIALARFGSFKGLHITVSGATPEIYPSTATLSFFGSTYTSAYIVFLPTEQCTNIASFSTSTAVEDCNGYKPLQTLSSLARKILLKYDFPPYVSSTYEGGIPFVDLGGKFLESGTFIGPSILAGFTHVQIAQSLGDPNAEPARTILVAANYYTAMICHLTGNYPSTICRMPVVEKADRQLPL